MKKIYSNLKKKATGLIGRMKCVLANSDGDQITGWLIVILLVVVVGAFFLNTYQSTIIDLWDAIVDKIYDTFGI
ncbi:MAG: hypothetical protein K5768_05585 [Firmicutes bacterium]|nr:hypothetical protein [Bacillota bacterium]